MYSRGHSEGDGVRTTTKAKRVFEELSNTVAASSPTYTPGVALCGEGDSLEIYVVGGRVVEQIIGARIIGDTRNGLPIRQPSHTGNGV